MYHLKNLKEVSDKSMLQLHRENLLFIWKRSWIILDLTRMTGILIILSTFMSRTIFFANTESTTQKSWGYFLHLFLMYICTYFLLIQSKPLILPSIDVITIGTPLTSQIEDLRRPHYSLAMCFPFYLCGFIFLECSQQNFFIQIYHFPIKFWPLH